MERNDIYQIIKIILMIAGLAIVVWLSDKIQICQVP